MTDLPSPAICHRWVMVNNFPAQNRFGRYSVIIDKCVTGDGSPHSIHVAYVRDHQFLRDVLTTLPHVPRAVRSTYQASVRLGFLMATDVWHVLRAMDAAHAAWAIYQRDVLK